MISITFKRRGGDTLMCVDATEFQKYLDTSLGCKRDWSGTYENLPSGGTTLIDASNMRIGVGAILKHGPYEMSLRTSFPRQPPSYKQLQALGASVEGVARDIIEHYRPIDISVRIVGKSDKPSVLPAPVVADTAPVEPNLF